MERILLTMRALNAIRRLAKKVVMKPVFFQQQERGNAFLRSSTTIPSLKEMFRLA